MQESVPAPQLIAESTPRAVLRLALPTWGAFVTHDFMGVVDMFFVGRLGSSAVAAVAMSGLAFGIIIMLTHGVSAGTTALVANAVGAGNRNQAQKVVGQSLTMSVLLAAVVALCGWLFSTEFLRLLGADQKVIDQGTTYLRIVTGGAVTMMSTIILGTALRAAGDAKTPFVAMVLANIVNAVLDPILIFGWAGLPALGVAGSAWATLVGRVVALALMTRTFFSGRHEYFHLRPTCLKPDPGLMAQIARIGMFASGQMLIRNIGGLALMRLVATFGTAAVAAYGIGMRLQMVIFGPSMGFGVAAATLVGQNLGAGNPSRARKSGWTAVGLVMAPVITFAIVFWVGGHYLIALFNREPAVVEIGATMLRWFSPSFAFVAMAFVFNRALAGAGDTLLPMLIVAVSLLLLGVPLAYALSHHFNSVQGVWAAIVSSNVAAGLLSALAFSSGRWVRTGIRIRELMSERMPATEQVAL